MMVGDCGDQLFDQRLRSLEIGRSTVEDEPGDAGVYDPAIDMESLRIDRPR
jgi:hypothetical protein